MGQFAERVKQLTEVYKKRLDDTFSLAVMYTLEDAQRPTFMGGNMPILTGATQDSLFIRSSSGFLAQGADSYKALPGALVAEDAVIASWSTPYVMTIHYGGFSAFHQVEIPGYHWATIAAMKWVANVERAVEVAKASNPS